MMLVLRMLERLHSDRDGGAIAEYGIILAMVSGVQWLERATRQIDTVTLWGAAAVVALVVGYALSPRR